VDEDSAIRIGHFQLVPCEMLGDDVVLGPDPSLEATTELAVGPPRAAPAEPTGTAGPVLRAAARALAAESPGDLWAHVLEGLLELSDADSASLVSCCDDRLLLRASRGKAVLSQRFLEATASRQGAWSISPGGGDPQPRLSSVSLSGFGPQATLTGLPFRARGDRVIAVAHLENLSGPMATTHEALDLYAELCGPVLQLSLDLDQATRRHEALSSRLGRSRGTRDSDAAGQDEHVLVGRDRRFRSALESIRQAAPTRATILIRGPSGSGKEELATLAHEMSDRRSQPFLAVNCAALPESLVESELFGADKGAYTGAEQPRAGAFAQADGGTIFLDEIGDLPLAAQAKILRVIETGEVVRVGGSRQRVDVRVVSATHRDLESMVGESKFREDLYYRLKVVELALPSLAQRSGDIPALAEHFLKQFRRPDGQSVEGVSVRAARALAGYAWPGNIRELRNVIERAVVLDRDAILDLDDLPPEVRSASGAGAERGAGGGAESFLDLPWSEARNGFEELYFRNALERSAGQVQKAARATGVDRRTLSEKIRRHRLKDTTD
jgi:DNA-binding NtrC family response regulator